MMNKEKQKKILTELLQEYPALQKDEKKLQDFLKSLEKIESKIAPSKEFKKVLRNRLDAMINFQKADYKKTQYFNFFIPVLSLFFVVFGFYYMQDSLFQGNINEPIQNQGDEMSKEEGRAFMKEILHPDIKIVGENDIGDDFSSESVQEVEISQMQIKKEPSIQEDTLFKKMSMPQGVSTSNEEPGSKENLSDVEDRQLIDLLGDGESTEMSVGLMPEASMSGEYGGLELDMVEFTDMGDENIDLMEGEEEIKTWRTELQRLLEEGCQKIQIDGDGNTCSLNTDKTEYNEGCTEFETTQKIDFPICVDKTEKK